MELVYTNQALLSLQEALGFLAPKVSDTTLNKTLSRILDAADTLKTEAYRGQVEPYLSHLKLGHRRIIEGHYKIIYRIIDNTVFITDIFDTRQDPDKIKG